jgi:hypothetical protein
MEVNLVDVNFVGRDLKVNPRYFKWITDNRKVSDHVFFTDAMLEKANKLKTDQKKIAWLLEPKAISPNIYTFIQKNYKNFYKVLTFDRELISKIDNGLFCPYGTYWVEDKEKYTKTKKVSMIMSFKNYTEGQSLRHNILNYGFRDIDFYGKFNNTKQINSKNEGLDSYYYSIAVENSIQDSYWTEKLLDCFITKTIPIYYGTKDVCNYFNNKGIIFFDSIDRLSRILPSLNSEIYNERLEYIEENYNKAKNYRDPEDYIYFNYPELLS